MSLSNPEIPLTIMMIIMKLAQRLEQQEQLADSPPNPWSKWLL
jgi:hypothetical protein